MRHRKLSPGLLLAYQDYENEGEQALTTHKRSLGIIAHKNHVNRFSLLQT